MPKASVQSLRFKTSKRRALDCVYGRSPFFTVPSRPEVRGLLLTSDRRPLENGMTRWPTTPGPMPPSATRLRLASLALVMGILSSGETFVGLYVMQYMGHQGVMGS